MSGGRADVTAFQLAAELVTDAPTSPSATTTSRLDRSRRDRSSDGREATSVTTALQDAVMRWGKMKQSLDGADDQRDGQRGGVSSSPSSGFLRHSWRLVEAERRPASPGMTSSSVHPWMLGRRWERADDLMQANALGRAVQQELGQRPDVASASERFYQHGLQLCGESARSTAGLSACLSAVPSAPTLAFFSFSEEEYDALTQPPPSPVPPSTVTFTYPSSCHLVELWGRFGNPVVVVDRWAGEMADKRKSSQQAHPFRFSAASSRDTETIRSSPSAALRVEETKGVDFAQAFVPTVEQACAEYSRVTSGVLGQRQQRLLRAVLAQQQEQQQEQQRQDSGQTSATSVQRTASAVSRRDSKTSSLPSADASGHAHTPFVASFDRYALLHCAKQPKAEERQEENTAVKATLTQAVQRPPATPPAGTAMAVGDEASTEPPSSPPAPSSPSSLSAATAAAGLTPQQHLLQCMTPIPWYTFMAEVERRAAVKELLGCERATNVPYQHAASKYLSLATTAAQALQRAAFMFDDRDREGQHQELAEVEEDTSFVSQRRADDAPTTPRCLGRVPPRSAFTVQLEPLPDVDPAAWRAAEAAVQKAAVEVLGTDAAGSAAPAAASAPASSARREQGRRGKRARADIAEGSHHGTKSAKRETNESARRASATTRRTKNSIKREEAEEEAGGELDDGSNESSVASDDGGSDDDTSENGSTSSEEDDAGGDSKVGLDRSLEELTAGGPEEGDAKGKRSAQGRRRGGGATAAAAAAATQASIAPSPSRVASLPPPSHLAADPSYRDVQAYITTVIPWRCTRLRVAAQAGWLLPPPPPLPHSLTDSLEEKEVVLVDVQAMLPPPASTASQRGGGADATGTAKRQDAAGLMGLNASPPNSAATGAAPCDDALYRPLMTEDEYQALRKISTAAVCNRVVSHTGEAVLLSLPPTVPRLYREVEQELERYLYDDTSAMMEVNATAQSLMAAIRTAYTQNTYLQRYTARLEHVVENLKKVEQECREAEKTSGDATLS